ncbi:MAG TPA: class I SAM-dependent methyltransferase [Steroidobacteraceae bacterium]|jgi:malonyl-CoA O-methyltransferase|nr:class I SAM-dependent methyltransferase [Steroidobacteraceae bacterium]
MSAPRTRELYERWAPRYDAEPHNPLMSAEQRAMVARFPRLAGHTVLDLACGTGRYARLAARAGARRVVGLDASPSMLARAAIDARVRGDLTALPFRRGAFDVVISGLALGHAANLEACVGEIARVLRPGGRLLYSDFHPEATRQGFRRGFRAADGQRFELPVDGYGVAQHRAALSAAGFEHVEVAEVRAGHELNDEFPGSTDFYRSWHGIPLVLIVQAARSAA